MRAASVILLALLSLGAVASASYAPQPTICHRDEVKIRRQKLGEYVGGKEQAYLDEKAKVDFLRWHWWLEQAKWSRKDIHHVLPYLGRNSTHRDLPNLSIAVSGGAMRAFLFGAGVLHAFDERFWERDRSVAGILQLSNHITGVSGSGWLITAWYMRHNQPLRLFVDSLNLEVPLMTPIPELVDQIKDDLFARFWAGYHVGGPDILGRALSYRFLQNRTEDVLFSSIRNTYQYRQAKVPYPIVLGLTQTHLEDVPAPEYAYPHFYDAMYEFTPYELGVAHPNLTGHPNGIYFPLDKIGTLMENGRAMKPKRFPTCECVTGYDDAGLIMSTTANLFGRTVVGQKLWKELKASSSALAWALDLLPDADKAVFPNPFRGTEPDLVDSKYADLWLIDGARTHENVPLWPLEHRHSDVVIAIEASSAGPDGYAESYSFWRSQLRSRKVYGETWRDKPQDYALIPDELVFRNSSKQAWFMGCDEPPGTLIIVYIPNYFVVAQTNHSGWTQSFSKKEVDDYFRNAFAIATQQESARTKGRGWVYCLGCIFLKRHAERNGRRLPSHCRACFDKYCWRRSYYD